MNITRLTARNARRLRAKEERKKMTVKDRQDLREKIINEMINKFGVWAIP